MCGSDVLGLADETAGGDTCGKVSEADLAFLGAGEGKLGVGREDDILKDVGALRTSHGHWSRRPPNPRRLRPSPLPKPQPALRSPTSRAPVVAQITEVAGVAGFWAKKIAATSPLTSSIESMSHPTPTSRAHRPLQLRRSLSQNHPPTITSRPRR
ncbi:hypothetical protein TIFTF001_037684, partial [Ficus carica]